VALAADAEVEKHTLVAGFSMREKSICPSLSFFDSEQPEMLHA
jgi:hypothetical protein